MDLNPGDRCLGPDPMSVGSKTEGIYKGPASDYRITPLDPKEGETIKRGRFEVDGRETIVDLDSLESLPEESSDEPQAS
jgi:hypothetical protein